LICSVTEPTHSTPEYDRSPGCSAIIRDNTRTDPPHRRIDLEGRASGPEVRRTFDLPAPPASLPVSLPAGFVARIAYPDVLLFEADAVGPLFYYVTPLFDANPALFVFVDGGSSPHPGLRAFVEQLGLTDQVCFVSTREAADERIRASTTA